MKLDRVVFCLNSSPTYSGMWDIVSEVYVKTTEIKPTLVFFGTQEELDNEVKGEYGEVYLMPRFDEFIFNKNLDWSVTWGAHWAIANKFTDDFCIFSGIDEIPLSTVLWDRLKDIDDSKYIIGLGRDPYKTGSDCLIASGQNCGKGRTFKEIFKIEDDLHAELKRVWDMRRSFPRHLILERSDWWGLDEAYISSVLFKEDRSFFLNDDWVQENLQSKKIDRGARCKYDIEKLNQKYYWAAHLVRPLSNQENRTIIDKLLKDIGLR